MRTFGTDRSYSRLFFVLLCVILSVQRLVGPAAVRYLVENAASVLQTHLDAFCQLGYLWINMAFQITRRTNYFRNFDGRSVCPRVFGPEFGPLIDQSGNPILRRDC